MFKSVEINAKIRRMKVYKLPASHGCSLKTGVCNSKKSYPRIVTCAHPNNFHQCILQLWFFFARVRVSSACFWKSNPLHFSVTLRKVPSMELFTFHDFPNSHWIHRFTGNNYHIENSLLICKIKINGLVSI